MEQDYTEAVKWYKLAAEQGDKFAQENLGWFYEYGRGVEQDKSEAVKWYRLAAEQGYADAVNSVIRLTEQDDAEAARLYRLAAEQGSDWAQFNLGVCYENGEGVERNRDEAVKWFRLAAEQGDTLAKEKLEELGEM